MKKTQLKTIVKLSRKKSGTVKVSENAIKLFDQANKRIQRLEKENAKRDTESQLKLEDVRSFRNSVENQRLERSPKLKQCQLNSTMRRSDLHEKL